MVGITADAIATHHNGKVTQSCDVFVVIIIWKSCWINSRVVSDLGRHDDHCRCSWKQPRSLAILSEAVFVKRIFRTKSQWCGIFIAQIFCFSGKWIDAGSGKSCPWTSGKPGSRCRFVPEETGGSKYGSLMYAQYLSQVWHKVMFQYKDRLSRYWGFLL